MLNLSSINFYNIFQMLLWELIKGLIFIKFSNNILMKNRVSKLIEIFGISAFVIFNSFSYVYLYQYGYWISNTCFVVACLIYLSIFYINEISDCLVVSFTYYITYWFITYITYFLFNSLNHYVAMSSIVLDYGSTVVALGLIYLFIARIIPKFMDYKKHEIDINQFVTLMFFCLVGFVSLMLYNNLFSITIGAICNVAILMLSMYINVLQEKEEKEKLLLERNQLLEEQDKLIKAKEAEKYQSYQNSKEAEEKMRRINHDLNHHFNYILSCIDDKDKIREYINKLKGEVNEVAKYFDTGSAIVDLILQEQYEKAEKLGIKLLVVGGFEEELKVEPAIVSIILGNLLNNAVEGASKAKSEFKNINVTFYQEPSKEFYLEVSNTADIDNLKMENGTLETTKEDKSSHGIGLKSVRKAVKDNKGTMRINTENNTFSVKVHIPIN